LIVYDGNKSSFLGDHDNRNIEDVIAAKYLQRTGRYAPHGEMRAWKASLAEMAKVLRDDEIPEDVGVGVEFGIPQTSKRIDFIISGRAKDNRPNLIIVELKQWSEASLTGKDGIILARRGGPTPEREGAHPCYQAWSYAALLEGFNEAIYEKNVVLKPCAYLHNYVRDDVVDNEFYGAYLDKAPLFLRGEEELSRLRQFIKDHVKSGDNGRLIYEIERGRIRPSKMLVDSLSGMLAGNTEFVLVDDQKVTFETAVATARSASNKRKSVVLVRGGPGTGKSVVAVNLLVQLSRLGLLCKYVSKNAAPRAVYTAKLTGSMRKSVISHMFTGSGSFTTSSENEFDALVVDEAHRLNEKSGLYGNLGDHQIKEIIHSSKCSIFFTDDDQVVTLKDIGTAEHIEACANAVGARVQHLELASQFRCSGSDGYLAWLDDALGIRSTANQQLNTHEYDFRVLDSPIEVHELITKKNSKNNKSRVVAGYCWDWVSKRDPTKTDITLPEFGYAKRWNLDQDGSLWIMAPKSVEQVGCIHTCQGLELDYVGVIIGTDMRFSNGSPSTHAESRSKNDRSIRGWKKMMKVDPEGTTAKLDRIIRNTYRTLMTRGMKGCYVYCVDHALGAHFKSRIQPSSAQ